MTKMQICLVITNGTRISYFENIRNLISYLGYQAGLYRCQQSITKGNIQILKNWVNVNIENFRMPVVQLAQEFDSLILHDILSLCNILAFRPKLEY